MTPDGPPLTPDTPVRWLAGVGPRRAARLERLGIRTVADLLRHLPARYEDLSRRPPIAEAQPGDTVTLAGRVEAVEDAHPGGRGRRPRFACTLADTSGAVRCIWFGRTRAPRLCTPGAAIVVAGRVQRWQGARQLVNPTLETADEARATASDTGGIRPVYPATEGIPPAVLRSLAAAALAVVDALPEALPPALRERRGFPPVAAALRAVHRPPDLHAAARGRDRLAYEELLAMQLALALRRRAVRAAAKSQRLRVDAALDRRIRARLAHPLTPGQEAAIAEIRADLVASRPMYRLLQGDVGSGKTMVAAYAMLAAVGNGAQAALLAPTEVLAEQHQATLSAILAGARAQPALLHGGQPPAERRGLEAALADGSCPLVVATHALLAEGVRFARCAVLVIDEQQRFGVAQKAEAVAKSGRPDVLVTTATPIPRTLALTLFGDLDLTVLHGFPPGRRPVATRWLRRRERERVWRAIQDTVRRGERVFVVAPRVAEGEDEVRSAEALAAELRAHVQGDIGVGLLHGRVPRDERQAVMAAFRAGRTPVLAATTVVEVGVDVPEATLMVIEDADRFGLAQLHQLRGRVGRGAQAGTCLCVADPKGREGRARLRAFVETTDGFRIAEADLALRGPGELLGLRQSGLPDLHAARLPEDVELLAQARDDARALVEADPGLAAPEHAALRAALLARYPDGGALLGVA